LIDNPFFQIGL